MTNKIREIEVRKGQYIVEFECDYCHKDTLERKSHYGRKKRHFCSMACYAKYREQIMRKALKELEKEENGQAQIQATCD